MKVAVIGTGYVGLVTGVSFAEYGNDVTCVDIDVEKIKKMRQGIPPIHEDGLPEMMKRNIDHGRLCFTTDLKEGVLDAAVIFLALPTPESEDGSADLKYILDVADQLGSLLKSYTVVVNKSTVPIGTADKVRERLGQNAKVAFDVVSNPEFLREGQAVKDVKKPDRIVIGSLSKKAVEIMSELYEPYVKNGHPIRFMSERSAELTKYGANGFLATKVSYFNELATLAELVGADIDDVRLAMGDDPRIGLAFTHVSLGWGGSCFPKDTRALIHIANGHGQDLKITKAADEANDEQKKSLPKKVIKYYKGSIKDKKIALWGLAFKKDTDDIRESPAVDVLLALLAAGAKVVAYDPQAIGNVKKLYGDNKSLSFVDSQYEALKDADTLVIATDWEEFTTTDFNKVKSLLRAPVIFDGRNLYKPAAMKRRGFYYESIGRAVVDPHA